MIIKAEIKDHSMDENELIVQDEFGFTEVHFRNVGKKNEDSAIQFTVKEYPKGKRLRYSSFSVPLHLCEEFIKRLQKVKA